MRRWAAAGHRYLAHLLLLGIVLQYYFAGLAAFGAASFDAHAAAGYALILGSIILAVMAFIGRLGGRVAGMSVALAVLAFLQPTLAFAPRVRFPAISALHVVNALVLLVLCLHLVRMEHLPRRAKA
jgi:hypothetical protein